MLGAWHQMLRCDRKSSAVLETDERCGYPLCLSAEIAVEIMAAIVLSKC